MANDSRNRSGSFQVPSPLPLLCLDCAWRDVGHSSVCNISKKPTYIIYLGRPSSVTHCVTLTLPHAATRHRVPQYWPRASPSRDRFLALNSLPHGSRPSNSPSECEARSASPSADRVTTSGNLTGTYVDRSPAISSSCSRAARRSSQSPRRSGSGAGGSQCPPCFRLAARRCRGSLCPSALGHRS